MIYKEVKYIDVMGDVDRLSMEGYREVDRYQGEPVMNINHEALSSLEDLQVIVAIDDSNIVGYHVALVSNDLFYQDLITACVLFYYMSPLFRGRGRGLGLFQYAEEKYKDKDVNRIFMSRKVYIPNKKLFDTLEYTHIEENYTKAMK